MAVTPSEAIAKLEAAMASGARSVTYSDGRRVEYRTQAEMEQAIAYWRGQISAAAGRPSVVSTLGAFHRD